MEKRAEWAWAKTDPETPTMQAKLEAVMAIINSSDLLPKIMAAEFPKLKSVLGTQYLKGIAELVMLNPKLDGLAQSCKILMNLHEVRAMNQAEIKQEA
eukprot:8442138-Pyramimonas_sp.AAC.1